MCIYVWEREREWTRDLVTLRQVFTAFVAITMWLPLCFCLWKEAIIISLRYFLLCNFSPQKKKESKQESIWFPGCDKGKKQDIFCFPSFALSSFPPCLSLPFFLPTCLFLYLSIFFISHFEQFLAEGMCQNPADRAESHMPSSRSHTECWSSKSIIGGISLKRHRHFRISIS